MADHEVPTMHGGPRAPGQYPRFGIRLANGYVNDNHGKGWPTNKEAEDQLSAWFFGGDNFGVAMSHHFSGAVVTPIDTTQAEAVR
ncbi:hypothetical protein [Mycobacteroides abscessus]|uniref:hypothetical protein n=1 Tax=Mycobacteroides abscessus TaxID=36809 RepID=UPI0009A5CF10|nr:hypothetical protein [Mycobacteroides abscessus]SKK25984.1 Uncharacterised protein [Mycobacteroides abscessus subsp. massiliense]SKK29234.1 Uncharacterised protein [Mycobacteroides abscessus subsp. massiliense]SKK51134.1 Uncharacterised protein [Mycobacteroides abscessus subsp. massiliense]